MMVIPPHRAALRGARATTTIRAKDESRLVEHLQFFGTFLRKPANVGAVMPSSPALARSLVKDCPFRTARLVVELGPGTGAVTKLILERLGRRTDFFALELAEEHVRALRRRFPGLTVYHDSAENIRRYLPRHGAREVDCVISGLPWASMKRAAQERIMEEVHRALAADGAFTTFAYVHSAWLPRARHFREWLMQNFKHVAISRVVWRNVPPAFVYHCRQPLR